MAIKNKMIIVIKSRRGDRILRGSFENDEELEKARKKCFKAKERYDKEVARAEKKLEKARLNEIKQYLSKKKWCRRLYVRGRV